MPNHYHKGSNVAVYYVNGGLGDDANNGTTPALAWDTIQKAFDKIADGTINNGDEVRIMGTTADATNYALTAALNPAWDAVELLITGANAAGDVDGTVVLIDGSNLNSSTPMLDMGATECERAVWANLHFDASDDAQYCVESAANNNYQVWVNCRFSQAVSNGVHRVGNTYWSMINCRFDNNGGDGMNAGNTSFGVIYKCLFDNNAGDGAESGVRDKWISCVFYNNGGDGANINTSGGIIVDCIFDNNTSDGLFDSGTTIQGVRVNNIYSNNAAYGVNHETNTDSMGFNEVFYNNNSDFDDVALVSVFNYTPGASGFNPSFVDRVNFDFTTGSTFEGHGLGMSTPYKWFGSTAADAGVGKWRSSETITIF